MYFYRISYKLLFFWGGVPISGTFWPISGVEYIAVSTDSQANVSNNSTGTDKLCPIHNY